MITDSFGRAPPAERRQIFPNGAAGASHGLMFIAAPRLDTAAINCAEGCAVGWQPVIKIPRGVAPRVWLGIEAEKRRVWNEIRGVSTTKSPSQSRKRRPRDFYRGLLGPFAAGE